MVHVPCASRVDANLEVAGRCRLFGTALFAFRRQKQNAPCPLRTFIELPERRRRRARFGVLGLGLEIVAKRLQGGRRPRARGSDLADGPNSEMCKEERYVEAIGSRQGVGSQIMIFKHVATACRLVALRRALCG